MGIYNTVIASFFISFLCHVFFFTTPASAQSLFNQTTPLPEGRQMHGAAVWGDYLYVIGGHRLLDQYSNDVEKAHILEDGQLTQWEDAAMLPDKRVYISNSTLAVNGCIYVIGGFNGDYNTNTVLWTRVLQNGDLEGWRNSSPFPGDGLSCLTATATPGHIHVIGGYTSGNLPSSKVYTGRLASNGDIAQWVEGPALPEPMWFHHATAAGGRIWVWGGLTTPRNNSVSRNVYSAPVLASGRIGGWRKEPVTLPVGFYRGACASVGDYLLTFSISYAGGNVSSDCAYARITQNGITSWNIIDTRLPSRLYVTAAADYARGNIYIPGGRSSVGNKTNLLQHTFIFQVKENDSSAGRPYPPTETETGENSADVKISGGSQHGVIADFIPYSRARDAVLGSNLPLVLYFHSEKGKQCEMQLEEISRGGGITDLKKRAVFGIVDMSQNPDATHRLGVFRAPAWKFYNRDGTVSFSTTDILTLEQIKRAVQSLR